MDSNRTFRDYATRISFNMSLTRNQIGVLGGITLQIEAYNYKGGFGHRIDQDFYHSFVDREMWVPGAKKLQEMGLVKHTNPSTMEPKWSRYPWELTEAGAHVVALLRIAGLIPQAAMNDEIKPCVATAS